MSKIVYDSVLRDLHERQQTTDPEDFHLTNCGIALLWAEQRIAELDAWKSEAVAVLLGWDAVFEQANITEGLGQLKSDLVGKRIATLESQLAAQQGGQGNE